MHLLFIILFALVVCLTNGVTDLPGAAPDWQGATREHTAVFDQGATPAGGMPRPGSVQPFAGHYTRITITSS